MRRPTNNDVSNRELSVEELEAIAAGFTLWGWLGSELTTLVNNTQVIYASKDPPPAPKAAALAPKAARIGSNRAKTFRNIKRGVMR